ncbi:hypothetical protein VUR80DRAFT_5632 [Thermomyces stellatus]
MRNAVSMQLISGTCPLPSQPSRLYILSILSPLLVPVSPFLCPPSTYLPPHPDLSFSCQSLFVEDWIVFLVTRFLLDGGNSSSASFGNVFFVQTSSRCSDRVKLGLLSGLSVRQFLVTRLSSVRTRKDVPAFSRHRTCRIYGPRQLCLPPSYQRYC